MNSSALERPRGHHNLLKLDEIEVRPQNFEGDQAHRLSHNSPFVSEYLPSCWPLETSSSRIWKTKRYPVGFFCCAVASRSMFPPTSAFTSANAVPNFSAYEFTLRQGTVIGCQGARQADITRAVMPASASICSSRSNTLPRLQRRTDHEKKLSTSYQKLCGENIPVSVSDTTQRLSQLCKQRCCHICSCSDVFPFTVRYYRMQWNSVCSVAKV